jgi:hypothetical protein
MMGTAPIFPSPSFFQRLRQLWRFNRLWVRAQRRDNSWGGEWRAVARNLSTLGVDTGCVVDVAASDGVTQSATLELFRSDRWSGLAVEMDPKKFAQLAYLYAGFRCQLAKCRVTPRNIESLLKAHEIPNDFDLLNLDIDSYDLFVAKELLARGYRPKIISMEINEKLPPPLFFAVLYDDGHCWQGDHFFGCSAVAAVETVKPYGYILESIQYNNAVFVRADLAPGLISDVQVLQAYRDGYSTKPDRLKLFPWNADVDCALQMSTEDALQFFKKQFGKYDGKYELRISTA